MTEEKDNLSNQYFTLVSSPRNQNPHIQLSFRRSVNCGKHLPICSQMKNTSQQGSPKQFEINCMYHTLNRTSFQTGVYLISVSFELGDARKLI